MDFTINIDDYIQKLKEAFDRLDRAEINGFASLLMDAHQRSAKIFIFGNGGSASASSHFACDMNKGVSYGLDKRFRIVPLTDNIATITAYANDVDYDDVFVEQLKNLLDPGDLVIGVSASGNSKNVLKAIEYANEKGNTSIGMTGYCGGKLRQLASFSINVNINDMQISEDIHFVLMHVMMKIMSKALRFRD